MARKLPWLKSDEKSSSKSSFAQPAKRQKTINRDSDRSTPLPTKPKKNLDALSRSARSPSTSPPPEPPTEEFMIDGLDRDDIYIMVEDEFHAIARTFTQHLHHAEYVRLKSLAKTRNASTVSNISRPVDSITAMRAETKKKKEAETREAKNKTALEQLKSTAPRPTSEDGDSSELEDGDEGHWKGTALQGFMTTNPSRNQTSLTGLQGIKSSTRAAAGFSKAEPKSSHISARPFDLASKQHKPKKPLPPTSTSTSTSTSEESDDDLDAPIPKRQTTIPKPPHPTTHKTPKPPPPPKPPTNHPKPPHHHHPPTPPSKNPPQPQPPRTTPTQTKATANQRLKARKAKKETSKEAKKRVNIDEIPIFLC